jgi:hypothetical protein
MDLFVLGTVLVANPLYCHRFVDFIGHMLLAQRLARQAPDDRTEQGCLSRTVETADEGLVFVYFKHKGFRVLPGRSAVPVQPAKAMRFDPAQIHHADDAAWPRHRALP